MIYEQNQAIPEDMATLLNSVNVRVRGGQETELNPHERACMTYEVVHAIAQAKPDTDQNWDGVLWWERFADEQEGSLADFVLRKGDPVANALVWLKESYQT